MTGGKSKPAAFKAKAAALGSRLAPDGGARNPTQNRPPNTPKKGYLTWIPTTNVAKRSEAMTS